MKKLLMTASILLLSQTLFASDWCEGQFKATYGTYFGQVASITIKNQEAIDLFSEMLPYNDCYHGVCAAEILKETGEIVVNFSAKSPSGNGYWAGGQAGYYTTFATDNGTWLNMQVDGEKKSFLFKGCYF